MPLNSGSRKCDPGSNGLSISGELVADTDPSMDVPPGSLHLVALSYTTGDIKDFLLTAKGKDKKNKENVTFKVRCSRSLYSLVITKSRQRS